MSVRDRKATAAIMADNLQNPSTQIVERHQVYSVPLGTTPPISFSGDVSRLCVKFNTGGIGIDTLPYKIVIPYQKIGNPMNNASVGIRKASDDSFQLIAEWPVHSDFLATDFIGMLIIGYPNYAMAADDRISIEYPPNETDTIVIGTSAASVPTGFVCEEYTGSYGAANNTLSMTITAKVLVEI